MILREVSLKESIENSTNLNNLIIRALETGLSDIQSIENEYKIRYLEQEIDEDNITISLNNFLKVNNEAKQILNNLIKKYNEAL